MCIRLPAVCRPFAWLSELKCATGLRLMTAEIEGIMNIADLLPRRHPLFAFHVHGSCQASFCDTWLFLV
jgi:hypothetical protein